MSLYLYQVLAQLQLKDLIVHVMKPIPIEGCLVSKTKHLNLAHWSLPTILLVNHLKCFSPLIEFLKLTHTLSTKRGLNMGQLYPTPCILMWPYTIPITSSSFCEPIIYMSA